MKMNKLAAAIAVVLASGPVMSAESIDADGVYQSTAGTYDGGTFTGAWNNAAFEYVETFEGNWVLVGSPSVVINDQEVAALALHPAVVGSDTAPFVSYGTGVDLSTQSELNILQGIVEGNATDIDIRVTSNRTLINGVTNQVANLHGRADGHDTRLTGAEGDIDSLESIVGDELIPGVKLTSATSTVLTTTVDSFLRTYEYSVANSLWYYKLADGSNHAITTTNLSTQTGFTTDQLLSENYDNVTTLDGDVLTIGSEATYADDTPATGLRGFIAQNTSDIADIVANGVGGGSVVTQSDVEALGFATEANTVDEDTVVSFDVNTGVASYSDSTADVDLASQLELDVVAQDVSNHRLDHNALQNQADATSTALGGKQDTLTTAQITSFTTDTDTQLSDTEISDLGYIKTDTTRADVEIEDIADLRIDNWVGAAPEQLNTIQEITTALADGELMANVITATIGTNRAASETADAAIQADVDANEIDSDNADAAIQADVDANKAAQALVNTAATDDRALIRTEAGNESADRVAAEGVIQSDVNQNEIDSDNADAAIQSDVNQNEIDSDNADAAIQSDVNQNEIDSDVADINMQADIDQNEIDSNLANSVATTDRASIRTEAVTEKAIRVAAEGVIQDGVDANAIDIANNASSMVNLIGINSFVGGSYTDGTTTYTETSEGIWEDQDGNTVLESDVIQAAAFNGDTLDTGTEAGLNAESSNSFNYDSGVATQKTINASSISDGFQQVVDYVDSQIHTDDEGRTHIGENSLITYEDEVKGVQVLTAEDADGVIAIEYDGAEIANKDYVDAEADRAVAAEAAIQSDVDANATDISTETARAKEVEGAIGGFVVREAVRTRNENANIRQEFRAADQAAAQDRSVMRKEYRGGIAAALAAGNIAYGNSDGVFMSAGVAGYGGQQAMAVGGSYRKGDKAMRVAVTQDQRNTGWTVGFTWKVK